MNEPFHDLTPRGDVLLVLELRCDQLPSLDVPASEDVPVSEDVLVSDDPIVVEEPTVSEESPPYKDVSSYSDNDLDQLEVRIRVSSGHLRLASTYFDKMLGGGWLEGSTLRNDGCVEVRLQNDSEKDPSAFLILLNIIHGHTRKVPRALDLKMLTRLAVLVDYYDCHEVIEVFSDIWIDGLKNALPKTYSADLVRWVWISWVFNKSEQFRDAMRIAQRQSKGAIKTYWLPIPSLIDGQYLNMA
jgi:hypothetical protein